MEEANDGARNVVGTFNRLRLFDLLQAACGNDLNIVQCSIDIHPPILVVSETIAKPVIDLMVPAALARIAKLVWCRLYRQRSPPIGMHY